MDTKPLSSVVSHWGSRSKLDLILLKEQDLVGLEDDSDFWNMEIDTSSVLTTEISPKKSCQPFKEPPKSKVRSSLQRIYPTNKGSASSDRNLKGLQSIHERTQVSQNIKLSEGRRLLPQPKRKRQINPNFDIQFTDLKNPELEDVDSNNSDDLPEAISAIDKEEPHPEMTTSSKVSKTNKMPVLSSSSRMVNSDLFGGHPTKRVKTTHSSAVSICSYLH